MKPPAPSSVIANGSVIPRRCPSMRGQVGWARNEATRAENKNSAAAIPKGTWAMALASPISAIKPKPSTRVRLPVVLANHSRGTARPRKARQMICPVPGSSGETSRKTPKVVSRPSRWIATAPSRLGVGQRPNRGESTAISARPSPKRPTRPGC